MPDVNLARLRGALHDYELGELEGLYLSLAEVLAEKRKRVKAKRKVHYWIPPLPVEVFAGHTKALCGRRMFNPIHDYKDEDGVMRATVTDITDTEVDYVTDFSLTTCLGCRKRSPDKLWRAPSEHFESWMWNRRRDEQW